MKISLYQNVTILDAVKDMFSAIDNADIFINHVVIVPDRFSLLSERLLLELLPNKAFFNVKVTNLTSYSMELLGMLGIKLDDVLSSGEVLLLTQKAIENVKDKLTTFKKSKIAFAYEISKLLSQFKSSSVSAEALNENAGGLAGAKYHDLKLIYQEYQHLLTGKLDANERLSLLNRNMSEKKVLNDTKLYFAGFDAFTKEGYELIKHLISSADEVSFAVAKNIDSGNEYIYEKDIYEKLTKFAVECGALINVVESKSVMTSHKESIVKGLYSYSKVKCQNDGFYNLYTANNISEEIEGVAKLIRYKVYNGLKFNNIQIAVSDLNRYQTQIENIFDKYDIPYYIDSSITADNTLLGRLVIEFLEAVSFGLCGDRLISLLSNMLLGDNSELIAKCQALNVDSKRKYKKYIEKDFQFGDLAKEIEKCNSCCDFGSKVLELIGRVLATFDGVIRLLEEKGELKEKNINSQVIDIIKESVELINKYEDEKIDIEEYIKKLKLLLSFKQVSTVPTYVDGVMIGDATKSYFIESDTLIVLGGQSLPITSLDNGILSDEELGANIKEIEPTIRMINRRNRFRLFSLLTIAQNQLFIFYQMMSEEGKKNELPSYISSLNNIFDQIEIRASSVFFARKPNSKERTILSADYGKLKKNNENLIKIDEKSVKNRKLLNFKPKEMMFNGNLIRVTQLEQYFSCPFKHFASYGLKLEEKKNYELEPRDIGNICHKGAEKFIKFLIGNHFNLNVDVESFIEENLSAILEEENLKDKIEMLDEKTSFIRYVKRQLKSNFSDLLREIGKSSFRPRYIERNFSPYKIKIGEEEFSIIGRADRIDEWGDYFRIIDYKTGSTGAIIKELYFGEKLQLFLYQKIVEKELAKRSAGGYYFNAKLDYSSSDDEKVILKGLAPNNEEILNALDSDVQELGKSKVLSIYKSSDGTIKGSAISKYSLESLKDYSLDVTKNAVQEISSGFINPMPNSSSCTYCKYRPLCGYEKSEGIRENKSEFVKFNEK